MKSQSALGEKLNEIRKSVWRWIGIQGMCLATVKKLTQKKAGTLECVSALLVGSWVDDSIGLMGAMGLMFWLGGLD